MGLWPLLRRKNEEIFGDQVVATCVPFDEHKKEFEKVIKGDRPDWSVQPLSPDLKLCEQARASRVLFYRATPVLISGTTDKFRTVDGVPDVRVEFEARVGMADVRKFVASSLAVPRTSGGEGGGTLGVAQLRDATVIVLTQHAGAYTMDQLGQIQPQGFAHLLAPGLSDSGFKVEAARILSVMAESVKRARDRAEEDRLNREIADKTCHDEALLFKVEQQLDAQQRQRELAAADKQILLARKARESVADEKRWEAEIERIELEMEISRTAVDKAKAELRRAQAEAHAVDEFRGRIPEILGSHLTGPLADAAERLKNSVSSAEDGMAKSVADFAAGLGRVAESAGGSARAFVAEMKGITQKVRDILAPFEEDVQGLRPLMAGFADRLAAGTMDVDQFVAEIRTTSPQIGGLSMVVGQFVDVVREVQALLIRQKSDLVAVIEGRVQADGWSPPAQALAEELLIRQKAVPAAVVEEMSVRARFMDAMSKRIQAQMEAGRPVPGLGLEILDADRIVIDRVTPTNVHSGMRKSGYAARKVGIDATYWIKIETRVPGYLWVITQGRCAEERPWLLFPFMSDLTQGISDRCWVTPNQPFCFPRDAGIDSDLATDEVAGTREDDRETIVVMLFNDTPPDGLVVFKGGAGRLPIKSVASLGGSEIDCWLDINLLSGLPLERWSCQMLRFDVKR